MKTYDVEREIRGQVPEICRAIRQKRVAPTLAGLIDTAGQRRGALRLSKLYTHL